MGNQPWASGPKEILQHGLSLLETDSDSNRRLALLSIDNAVELMIKTYLGLPRRVTGINISRKQYGEISESFPKMLDALEEHAEEYLSGIDLGEIEWFHRLRNQLYHQGNGLTIAREQVEVYSELSKLLFQNLFGEELSVTLDDDHRLLGEFLSTWVSFEKLVAQLSEENIEKMSTLKGRPRPPLAAISELIHLGLFSRKDGERIEEFRKLRNKVIHGQSDFHEVLTQQDIIELKSLVEKYSK